MLLCYFASLASATRPERINLVQVVTSLQTGLAVAQRMLPRLAEAGSDSVEAGQRAWDEFAGIVGYDGGEGARSFQRSLRYVCQGSLETHPAMAMIKVGLQTGRMKPLMTDEYVIPYDIGCEPSPSGSAEVIIQSEAHTFVLFLAMNTGSVERGLDDLIAVVECQNCSLTKFGYPNDEGVWEHPLFLKGLDRFSGVLEVINSSWKAALEEQMDTSARRIHRGNYHDLYDVPVGGKRQWKWKHFIFRFKENTFECIADSLKVNFVRKVLQGDFHRDIRAAKRGFMKFSNGCSGAPEAFENKAVERQSI